MSPHHGQDSFKRFMSENKPALDGYAVNVAKGERLPLHHVDDIRQEGLTVTWRKWNSWLILEEEPVQKAYAFTSMHNVGRNISAKIDRRRTDPCPPEELGVQWSHSFDGDPFRQTLARDTLTIVSNALLSMSDRQRQIIQMKMVDLDQRSIATVLGVSQATVSRHSSNALNSLRQAVGEETLRELGLADEGGGVA